MCIIELRKHVTLKIIAGLKKILTLVGLEPRAFAPRPTIPPPRLLKLNSGVPLTIAYKNRSVLNKPVYGAGCMQEVPDLYPLGKKILRG